MLSRRIVTSVCALCFAIPATAVASPPAKGPYGISPATGTSTTAAGTAAARGNGTSYWRIVAIGEAALLAFLALGLAHLLAARRHAPRIVT